MITLINIRKWTSVLAPLGEMRYFVAVLAVMACAMTVNAAGVDTLWVEVPDTVLVKKQRPVVKEDSLKFEMPIFFKIRQSDSRFAVGIDSAVTKVTGLMKTSEDARFTVTGFADKGTGNAKLNDMYSMRRVDDVSWRLIHMFGVDRSRLTSDFKGDRVQPFAENDKNRCVIITGEGTQKIAGIEDEVTQVITTKMVPQLVEQPCDALQSSGRLPRREFLSVKTNLLLDVAYVPGYDRWCPIPNIAVEYYPLHGHFTYGASLDFPWWRHYDKYKFFELRNYQLEARYYLRSGDVHRNIPGQGAAYRGFYLQGYAHAGVFLFCFNADKGWTGEFLGGGVGCGYVMPLSKKGRWRLEFGAQFGYIYSVYDPFQYEYRGPVDLHDDLYYYDWVLPASQFKKRQYRYSWFGPTRVGITLSYDLLFRRHGKRGVSLKSYQKVERRYEP